jgi:hypothetical protein
METVTKLAAITDAAQFERIATSVLRAANPQLYANLSHQGVNTDGKTVKAPLDNVGWVNADDGAMLVAAAHTTAARSDLEGKWLHDPSTVTPRKPGRRPTQPAGDLVKAIEEIQKLREQYPAIKATLALTCNREEPADVRLKAEMLAGLNDVILDVWSASRLAQFLDTKPDGQVIRFEYFGVEPSHLSKQELLRIGRQSLASRQIVAEEGALVSRHLASLCGHVFLSGASGMGKTTICLSILLEALKRDQPGIVLEDQTVMRAATLEEALDIELRRYSPSLIPHSGARALEMCSEAQPLIIVVEDINRSENTERLLDKLLGWALQKAPGAGGIRWRLICPVWPRFLVSVDKNKRDAAHKAGIVQIIGLYTDEEAREAVKRRSEILRRPVDDLAASAIAHALGNDPLLIGLHNPRSCAPSYDVIAQYLADELERAAIKTSFTATDLEDAILSVGIQMLGRRNLQPTWRDVQTWLGEGSELAALRALVGNTQLLRLTKSGRGEVLEARHDRVLYHLLANVVERQFSLQSEAEYVYDPYFAEIIGIAVVASSQPLDRLRHIMASNPLVAFYALKHALVIQSEYVQIASKAVEEWIQAEEHSGDTFFSRRHWGLVILAEIDSPLIIDLTSHFPKSDARRPYFEARFRNGDVIAGFDWLTEYKFDVEISGQKELINYVHRKYGDRLLKAVSAALKNPELSDRHRKGALILAGYIGQRTLADSVRAAWQHADARQHLEAFLWASARVCGDEAEKTLGPICDAWEALPDSRDEGGSSERNSLAADGISWKFRHHVPRSALPYLVDRAKRSQALLWPITYMLRGVDDPVAVEHEVSYLAQRNREAGEKGLIDHFLKDEWRRLTTDMGRRMSTESKERLLSISADFSNDEHLRKQAFSLWEVSVGPNDVDIARSITEDDVRYEKSLWARARRSDITVVPQVLERIGKNPPYWWQVGRYLWTEDFTQGLGKSIKEIAELEDAEHIDNATWIFPELILGLDTDTAESLLLPSWSKIRHIPNFLQTALCVGSPVLLELVGTAVEDSTNPQKLFEYFSSTVGVRTKGQGGIDDLQKMRTIQPYFGLLSDLDLHHLWENCIEKGWLTYARQHLEPILQCRDSEYIRRVFGQPMVDISTLDNALDKEERWRSYYWVRDEMRRGKTREEIITALFNWFEGRKTLCSLRVVSSALAETGNRSDFERLRKIVPYIVGADDILNQVRFNIFRRTLA